MNTPNAENYRGADVDYLRELVAAAKLSQRAAARRIGVGERTMRNYLSGRTPCPYAVQYALEMLAIEAHPEV